MRRNHATLFVVRTPFVNYQKANAWKVFCVICVSFLLIFDEFLSVPLNQLNEVCREY